MKVWVVEAVEPTADSGFERLGVFATAELANAEAEKWTTKSLNIDELDVTGLSAEVQTLVDAALGIVVYIGEGGEYNRIRANLMAALVAFRPEPLTSATSDVKHQP